MLTEFFFFSLCLSVFLYLNFTSTFGYWKKLGIKYVKPIPVLGNSLDIALLKKSSIELFQSFYDIEDFKSDRFVGIFLGKRPCLLVRDLELIKKIMVKDFQYFSDRGIKFDDKKSPLSAHLFNLRGKQWRSLRMKLTPIFTSGKIRIMYNTMKECAEMLEKALEGPAKKRAVMEMKEPLAQFTTDIIGTCAFGLQFNSLENPNCEFREMGRRIFKASVRNGIKRALLTTLPSLANFLGLRFVDSDLSEFFMNQVNSTVREREEKNIKRNDLMQLMIDLKNKRNLADSETPHPANDATHEKYTIDMTNSLIAAQAFVFFIAGFETSSSTMGFTLYELALNPDIQEKLAEEISTAIEDNNGELNYECLLGIKYLDMVIAETLRKYPPIGSLFRRVVQPYEIEGTDIVLEQDLRVIIPAYAIQRDPKYYPNPDKFDPERFAAGEKAKRHPMSYLPFGDGPRNCIGARFGLLQTKLGLCTLLRKFKFEVCKETRFPTKLEPKGFVTTVKGGIMLRISERNQQIYDAQA